MQSAYSTPLLSLSENFHRVPAVECNGTGWDLDTEFMRKHYRGPDLWLMILKGIHFGWKRHNTPLTIHPSSEAA